MDDDLALFMQEIEQVEAQVKAEADSAPPLNPLPAKPPPPTAPPPVALRGATISAAPARAGEPGPSNHEPPASHMPLPPSEPYQPFQPSGYQPMPVPQPPPLQTAPPPPHPYPPLMPAGGAYNPFQPGYGGAPEPPPHGIHAYPRAPNPTPNPGAFAHPPRPQDDSSDGAKKAVVRGIAGRKWVDSTMADWPEGDFRLFVGNLGGDVTDDILARYFTRYPSFAKARVVRDKYTRKARGYGFVSLLDNGDAARAIKEMNGEYIGNRPIKISRLEAQDRTLGVLVEGQYYKKKREEGSGASEGEGTAGAPAAKKAHISKENPSGAVPKGAAAAPAIMVIPGLPSSTAEMQAVTAAAAAAATAGAAPAAAVAVGGAAIDFTGRSAAAAANPLAAFQLVSQPKTQKAKVQYLAANKKKKKHHIPGLPDFV